MIYFYNTLTRKKEEFKAIESKLVKIYSCGPTVYHYAHLGNLRYYTFCDLLKRSLVFLDYKVKHVMNITDVGHLTSDSDTGEDKLEKGAKRENKSVWEVAEYFTKEFLKDEERLNIIKADVICKATDHIKEQVDIINEIAKKGYCYVIEDGIYFDTSKLENYNILSKQDLKELQEGIRIDVKDKKQGTDFALWKTSPVNEKRQMEWTNTFTVLLNKEDYEKLTKIKSKNLKLLSYEKGIAKISISGFPGWHIECSAMSTKYLGKVFDIHTGGIDHINIHHTNEIAQNMAAYGKNPANYWMHSEFLVLKDNVKMSKSTGDFVRLQTLLDNGYSALDYRYFCLTAHYRKPLNFSYDALDSAKNSLKKLQEKVLLIKSENKKGSDAEKYLKRFTKEISDDLNIPNCLAILWELVNDEKIDSKEKYKTIILFDSVFGLKLDSIKKEKIPENILNLAEKREKFRKEKNWKDSDKIREEIEKLGFIVKDEKDGFKVERK